MKNPINLCVTCSPGYLRKFQPGSSIFSIPVIILTLLLPVLTHVPAKADNVIINGSTMTVVAGTSVVSMNNLTINVGGALNNAGMVTLKMNLTNENPTPDSLGTGTISLSGTSTQTIGGQNIFQNLIVNNPQGVSIAGNTRVNGVLNLTNGNISIGNKNLSLGPYANIAGTPSSTVMIIVTGSGELRKEFPAGFTGIFTYPVGDNTGTPEYSPVALNFIGGTFDSGNYAGVNLKNSIYPDPSITGNYLNRYWNISQSGIDNFNCSATFQYLPFDVVGTESMISCTKVSPLPWVTYALANTAIHQLSASGITSFSAFTGVKSSTPPENLELVNITIPGGVTNCYDATKVLTVAGPDKTFIVENNGSVTLVAGIRISILPGTKVYSGGYLHAYITADGTYCGSAKNPLVATFESGEATGIETTIKNKMIKIYPNPTADLVVVELLENEASGMANVTVYNIQGGKIMQKTSNGGSRFQFSLSGKPVGVYMVHVQSGNKSEIAKIIKK